jgi:cytidylate kinase
MSDDWSMRGQPQDGSSEWGRPHGEPVDLITISREFGAGGGELAQRLGLKLPWPVLDRDLVQNVADRLRLDPRHVEPLDERTSSWLTRLVSSALLITPPEVPIDVETGATISADAVAEAARAAILAAAQSPPLVVVGHGSQCLFHDRAGALHVRVFAPLACRVARISRREGCDAATAAAIAHRLDDARRAYVRRHYHTDLRDPLLYDVQINTGSMALDEAVDAIAAIVNARAGAAVAN